MNLCRDPQKLVQRSLDRTGRGQVYVMGPEHPWKEAATVTQVDRMSSHGVSGLPKVAQALGNWARLGERLERTHTGRPFLQPKW